MNQDQRPPVLIKQMVKFIWNGKITLARCYAKETTNMLVVVKGEQQPIRISTSEVIEFIDKNKGIKGVDI